MVVAISFDTATKSLAISIIEYNVNYVDDLEIELNKFINAKNSLGGSSSLLKPLEKSNELSNSCNKILNDYNDMLINMNKIMDNKLIIHYLSVVDLIPDMKLVDTNIIFRTKKLHEYLNNILDPIISQFLDKEIIFLLEYQMGPNVKSNAISTQIMYHLTKYTYNSNIQISFDDKYNGNGQEPKNKQEPKIQQEPNNKKETKNKQEPNNKKETKSKQELKSKKKATNVETNTEKSSIDFSKNTINIVGPSLKNKVNICHGGEYSNFIEKYRTNYAANKNHTKFNALKLLELLDKKDMIIDIKKKNLDDISDSIMMSIAFILKNYWN
jgi:hypothetical protein